MKPSLSISGSVCLLLLVCLYGSAGAVKMELEEMKSCVSEIEAKLGEVQVPAGPQKLADDAMKAIKHPSGSLLVSVESFWTQAWNDFREQLKHVKAFSECSQFADKVAGTLESIECAEVMADQRGPDYTKYRQLISKNPTIDNVVGAAALCDYLTMFH